jgi:hypothetical protein
MASHITDNLKMLHRYNTGSVVPVSDGAVYFDGTASRATAGSTETITGDITITFWAMGTFSPTLADYSIAVSLGVEANDADFIWIGVGTGANYFRLKYGTDADGAAGSLRYDDHYVQNEWIHWAVTLDVSSGTPQVVYKNGVILASDSTAVGQPEAEFTSRTWTLGSYNASDNDQWEGYMCNVGVWNSVLTQAQIKSVMFSDYSGAKSTAGNPLHWWACDEESGTTLTDQGSRGLNLALTGT